MFIGTLRDELKRTEKGALCQEENGDLSLAVSSFSRVRGCRWGESGVLPIDSRSLCDRPARFTCPIRRTGLAGSRRFRHGMGVLWPALECSAKQSSDSPGVVFSFSVACRRLSGTLAGLMPGEGVLNQQKRTSEAKERMEPGGKE